MADHPGRRVVMARAMDTLWALQCGRPTLRQLASRMGVSERTARRYVDAAIDARIPVRKCGPHYRIEVRA